MECIYFNDCNVEKRPICLGVYENCFVYRRRKVLDKLRRQECKSGLERFKERYPSWREMFVGSKK